MNSKVEQHGSASAGDFVKYALAVLLVAGGVFAFYWFDWATALRALVVVAGLVAGIGVFLTSAKGHQTLEFLSESRFELRKVVWPTRQEAMRTTWVVMIAVAILSLILAGFDLIIAELVKLILGH
ncbi:MULTISPECIES: preprotein translocase subunit SecE [unclassified Lysobacter]|uniref:preprotein translocase subunit SecE n=1 Tax=unclassified Lysobacter TaxID=2635362 RepID=UPI0006F4A78B|nr:MULTISPECIES: preprotein translocase subunit SecE [unclassified Lysobacter]KRA14400.1 preprotein translocase subunit SecE [Lysobacter sp. Root604]KRD37123.1 preprotein translocase subunit SecE [Lysobacter sp. Root916]KRD78244.1 preprotein translocase subunit SecE [Lysobacter sp. Root983]